jgi:hypothetical protein
MIMRTGFAGYVWAVTGVAIASAAAQASLTTADAHPRIPPGVRVPPALPGQPPRREPARRARAGGTILRTDFGESGRSAKRTAHAMLATTGLSIELSFVGRQCAAWRPCRGIRMS